MPGCSNITGIYETNKEMCQCYEWFFLEHTNGWQDGYFSVPLSNKLIRRTRDTIGSPLRRKSFS